MKVLYLDDIQGVPHLAWCAKMLEEMSGADWNRTIFSSAAKREIALWNFGGYIRLAWQASYCSYNQAAGTTGVGIFDCIAKIDLKRKRVIHEFVMRHFSIVLF